MHRGHAHTRQGAYRKSHTNRLHDSGASFLKKNRRDAFGMAEAMGTDDVVDGAHCENQSGMATLMVND